MEWDDNQKKTYLTLLEASLIKKSDILDQLLLLSMEQEKLISEEVLDEVRFYKIIDEKESLIQAILQLDQGFEQIYKRVKEELSVNRGFYQKEIVRLQKLIKDITEKGISIQVLERRNKAKIDFYLQTKRKKIKNFKISSKSVSSYYNNMANQNQHESYFFDKKK